MCEVCGKFNCPSGCPNAPEPIAVFVCSGCGDDIYEGDDYYDIMGEQFCQDCIDDSRHTAMYEEF